MKDIYYINDLEKLKALADPLRVDIITTLGTTKQNSQQLAKKLKINRTRIHYHLNILEEMGFIKVVDTDVVNGIIQKHYLPTAHAFVPSANIFNKLFKENTIEFSLNKSQEQQFLLEFEKLVEKYSNKNEGKEKVTYSLLNI